MAKAMPYYPMYAFDFDEDPNVLAMNLSEVGLYLLALNEAWKRGSIPDDPASLANLIRRPVADVKRAWLKVQTCWIGNGTPGRLINPRLEKEREKAASISEARSVAASIRHLPANAKALQNDLHDRMQTYDYVSGSLSGSGSQISGNSETRERERASAETLMRLWCDHRGFKKPQRSQRNTILDRLAALDLSEAEAKLSMDGFHCSEWGSKSGWPIFGWMKNPLSWIIDTLEVEPDPVEREAILPGRISPIPTMRDFPGEWNAIVKAAPVEWNPKFSPVKQLADCDTSDPQFGESFAEVCRLAQAAHEAKGHEAEWITFEWVIRKHPTKGFGWWRLRTEFKGLAKNTKKQPGGESSFKKLVRETMEKEAREAQAR